MRIFHSILLAATFTVLIPQLIIIVSVVVFKRVYTEDLIIKMSTGQHVEQTSLRDTFRILYDINNGNIVSVGKLEGRNVYLMNIVHKDTKLKHSITDLRIGSTLHRGYCQTGNDNKGHCFFVDSETLSKRTAEFHGLARG